MRTTIRVLAATAAAVAFGAADASAQITQNLTMTATVNARASLTLSVAAVNFPDSDPDTVPNISADNPVLVTAKSRTAGGNPVTLTVQAGTDLTSGSDVIPVSNISWAANGDLAGGSLATSPVTLVNSSNSGLRTGTMSFVLLNDWAYVPGSYTATVTYTLSAP
jgi:hypothetical protein